VAEVGWIGDPTDGKKSATVAPTYVWSGEEKVQYLQLLQGGEKSSMARKVRGWRSKRKGYKMHGGRRSRSNRVSKRWLKEREERDAKRWLEEGGWVGAQSGGWKEGLHLLAEKEKE
jgi:hypothetical protein